TEVTPEPAVETVVDLLPTPREEPPEPIAPPRPEVITPLRVVENGTSHEPHVAAESSPNGTGDHRILSATSSAARATRTAVRDLRDGFMVTVSSPGDTITRSQPPEGVTGSIGGVTPLFQEPVAVVRVRNLILVILGFVALVVLIAAGVTILVERRL